MACSHQRCCRWLPTRILRDCRFAPTAELDLHLYAIGCDIVIMPPHGVLLRLLKLCNTVHMSQTLHSCSCVIPLPGLLQVLPRAPFALPERFLLRECFLNQSALRLTHHRAGTSLSLAKYLRPERLPAVFRSIDW